LILKIARAIKAHIQSNIQVPHPTVVAFGISTAVTFLVLGIVYMFHTGIIGIGAAEAATKFHPRCCD